MHNDDTIELPDGWEPRVTKEGRKFYVDHNTKSTHWELPKALVKKASPVGVDAGAAASFAADTLSSAFEGLLPTVASMKETVGTFATAAAHEIGKSEVFQEIKQKNAPLAAFLGQSTVVEHDEAAELAHEAEQNRLKCPIGKLEVVVCQGVGLQANGSALVSPYVKVSCPCFSILSLLTTSRVRAGSLPGPASRYRTRAPRRERKHATPRGTVLVRCVRPLW